MDVEQLHTAMPPEDKRFLQFAAKKLDTPVAHLLHYGALTMAWNSLEGLEESARREWGGLPSWAQELRERRHQWKRQQQDRVQDGDS